MVLKMGLKLFHNGASIHMGTMSRIMTFFGRKGRKVGIAHGHNDLILFVFNLDLSLKD